MCKERLLQRLAARGIPPCLVDWINTFCFERTATIVVNGRASELSRLEQAGLPQGSPLSLILFLFFNADLVQQRIDQNGGAIAFVDDYTAWAVGNTAAENQGRLQTIVRQATAWESRSGASFEGDKTSFIHFTRNSNRSADEPILVKGREIKPTSSVKILGLVMGSELRYKKHRACRNEGSTRGHGVEAAARALAIGDAQTVRRNSGPGGRFRIVRVDARKGSQGRQGAQPSTKAGRSCSDWMFPNSRHGGGGGRS